MHTLYITSAVLFLLFQIFIVIRTRRATLQLQAERQVPTSRAELRFPRERTWMAWSFAAAAAVVMVATLDHFTFFAVNSLALGLWTAFSLHSQLLVVAFDEEAVELRFWNCRVARISWSQLAQVELSRDHFPSMILSERDGTRMTFDPALHNFDLLCAALLRKAPLQTRISPEASRLLLNRARLSIEELLELYGPRYLADPSIHGYLWDPRVDPYESWREVAATLATQLFHTRGESPDFVLAWEKQGGVRVYPGSALPRSLRSWARCQRQGQQLRIEVEDQGYGPRNYLHPLNA